MSKFACIVIANFNNSLQIFPKTIRYIDDPEHCYFLIIDGGSSKQQLGYLYSELKSHPEIQWCILKHRDYGLDIGAYYDWMKYLINPDLKLFSDLGSNIKDKNVLIETDITWFLQEHMSEHMINITSLRGWQRDYTDRLNLQVCKDFLDVNPKDQIGTDGATWDERYGYTPWHPGPLYTIGRDVNKEKEGIVDHDYWNKKFDLDPAKTHSGFGCNCLKNDRIKEIFSTIEITSEEEKRKGFAWEAERFISLQINEKYGGQHKCYWDVGYDESNDRSWFSENLLKRIWSGEFYIPKSELVNDMLHDLYGFKKGEIQEQWNEDQIYEEMKRRFGHGK